MSARLLAVLAAGLPLLLAGCLAPGLNPAATLEKPALAPAATPLWFNPQTTPHPMFGYPTLTQPATGANVPKWWEPIAAKALPQKIAGLVHVAATGEKAGIPAGAGMSVFGSLAVVPGDGASTEVVDISDPAHPVVLSTIKQSHRNVDFIPYPTGRLVAVFAGTDGEIKSWDLTDPTKPFELPSMKPTTGVHKVNVMPGSPIVYNANSNGAGDFIVQERTVAGAKGVTEIFDLTDPDHPVHVQDFKNGYGCHHIYFWNNPAVNKSRTLCAGIEATQIWDTADPRNPKVIVTVPVHHGNPNLPSTSLSIESFSHFAILNYKGDTLIVGDESGGGGFPPGCFASANVAGKTVSAPLGDLWFYDVKDEKNPKLLGWYEPTIPLDSNPPNPADGPGAAFYSCTAHHGRLVPAPDGRQLLAMAFYRAGVVLVDFTDPSNPWGISQWNEGTNTWEAQYYNGYVFTGDLSRGMDVLSFK